VSSLNLVYFGSTNYENWGLQIRPRKRVRKIGWIINNSASDCWILLKSGMWMHYDTAEVVKLKAGALWVS